MAILLILTLLAQKLSQARSTSEHVAHKRFLSTVPEVYAKVGFGVLGKHGKLGYENREVSILGQPYLHSLSTHPPYASSAIVKYDISRFSRRANDHQVRLVSRAAVNDKNNYRRRTGSLLTWHIFADGKEKWASVPMDRPGHTQTADILLAGAFAFAFVLLVITRCFCPCGCESLSLSLSLLSHTYYCRSTGTKHESRTTHPDILCACTEREREREREREGA